MSDSKLNQIASRHGFSEEAAWVVHRALVASGGTLAQFSHAELGGTGQWMPGMVQIGEMFNDRLKQRVAALCADVAALVTATPQTESVATPRAQAAHHWWPEHLGSAGSAGGQDGIRYAYFPQRHLLLVDRQGDLAAFDTGAHAISGVAQAQGERTQLVFTSQQGPVSLESLKRVPMP